MFWIFKENYYYTLNGVNGAFLDPDATFLLICLLGFYKMIPDGSQQKWANVTVLDFEEKSILCLYEVNRSSVEPGGQM